MTRKTFYEKYRPVVDRCHNWQPKKAPKSFDSNDINRIVRMLIDMSPELDDLRSIKKGLDGYLSIFDNKMIEDYDDIDCHPDYDAKTDSIKEKTDDVN